jgi:hypothetical protein
MMAQQCPETEQSIHAMEGEASHEIAAKMISAATRGNIGMPTRAIIDETASNGIIIRDDMFDAAKMYADNVITEMQERRVFDPYVEYKIKAPRVHALSFGTVDAGLYDHKEKHLIVWDYKFGFEVVEAFENWQGINYVAGLLDDLVGIDDQHTRVTIRIVQPRAMHRNGPIREWSVMASDLRGYINTLNHNAHKALSNEAECHSGTHCKHCQARHGCEAAITAGMGLFEATSKPQVLQMSPAATGLQYSIIHRARKHLESLETAFEAQIMGMIRKGVGVPGWMVEPKIGRLKWDKPINEVVAMGDMMEHDLRKNEAITPTQAIALGVDESVIMAYSSKSNTGLNLVPDDETKTREVFKS